MPFHNHVARTFKAAAVLRDAPTASGVYGLSNALEWIYVGETDNIQATLIEHLKGTGTLLGERVPTGFIFEVCAPERRVLRQRRLILELEPACNRSIASRSKSHRAGDATSLAERS